MRYAASLVIGILVVPAALLAQDPRPAVGTRVRLTTQQQTASGTSKTEHLHGTVADWRGDTIVLRVNNSLVTAIPLDRVSRLSVSRGRAPDPLGGALKGGAVGAVAGLAVLGALCGEKDIDPSPGEAGESSCTLSDFGVLLLGTVMLGVAGAAVGLVVGTVIGAERWQPLSLGPTRLSLRPLGGGGAGGVGVGLSFSF